MYMMTTDERHMRHALHLAETQRGWCAPNPSVGAVLAVADTVISTGVHRGPGTMHAEVDALNAFSVAPHDATLYVTLEPCCHFGRTPPCTDLIIAKKIQRVIYGFTDPNPQVAGQGQAKLIEAGIQCEQLSLAAITDFYHSYQYWWQHRQPVFTAKIAQSLDGKIGLVQQQPVRLTGTDIETITMQGRLQADAILTTAQTIRADDPRLNVRLNDQTIKKTVVVLDRRLTIAKDAALFATTEKVIIMHGEQVSINARPDLNDADIELIAIPERNDGLDLKIVAETLGKLGFHDVWVEAGGVLLSQLLRLQLVTRLLVYIAPRWLGDGAIPALTQRKSVV